MIESDRHVTVREIEEMLKISKSTIDRHIQHLGLVKKCDIWIQREFEEIHLRKVCKPDRTKICSHIIVNAKNQGSIRAQLMPQCEIFGSLFC